MVTEIIPVLKAALDYVKRYSWRLIPLGPRSKVPFIKGWVQEASDKPDRLEEWFRQWPEAGIGVLLGHEAGTVVLDVDGPQGVELVRGMHLPDTLTATTGKGKHYFFRSPDLQVRKQIRKFPEIDLLGEGCFVVVEPSIHPEGKQYRFDNYGHELAVLPDVLIERFSLRDSQVVENKTLPVTGAAVIPEGKRNITLTSEAGKLRRRGLGFSGIHPELQAINLERCMPPLPESEVGAIAKSICRYEPEAKQYNLSDDGNAQRFLDLHGSELLHCKEQRNQWYTWDRVRFKADQTGQVYYLARDVAQHLKDEADSLPNKPENQAKRSQLYSFSIQSENQHRLKALVERAAVYPAIAVTPEELDRDPMRLCVRNGYLNLRTGKLESPDPKKRITRQASVFFRPNATCPRWLNHIEKATCGRRELAVFLQELGGYLLTGMTCEDKFFMFIGGGANGKSSILETLVAILGEYAVLPPSGTFLERRFNNPSAATPELAMLRGARLALVSETDRGDKVALGLLKRLSSGGKGSSRELYTGLETSAPTAKIVIDTNYAPRIQSGDFGTWRRVCRVPFDYKFQGAELIKDFREKMVHDEYGEHSGILNWLIEGCLRWQEKGYLVLPAEVTEATEAYQQEEDPVKRFLEDCTIKGDGFSAQAAALYAAFKDWCAENGERVDLSQVAFADALKSLGTKKGRKNRGVIYLDIRLRTEEDI